MQIANVVSKEEWENIYKWNSIFRLQKERIWGALAFHSKETLKTKLLVIILLLLAL
jgi:hypothetical protein